MSVLCCRIPNFLIALARRRQPTWAGQPLVLLGPDERLWAVSPEAQQCGVQVQMSPQQARVYCPEVLVRELDLAASQTEQSAFWATAACWELPVESLTWGAIYIDLHAVGRTAAAVQPLAVELGRRVRSVCGASMQPALGWDSGKFTANVAAVKTAPGRVRLIDKADELRFLRPLPVTLLPLPQPQLQQLHWLGIRTLGQYAALPAAAVWQRFGAAGKLAHRWAQGRDDRPVRSTTPAAATIATVAIDPPSGVLQRVVAEVMSQLQPDLARWAKALVGLRHLRVTLDFVAAAQQSLDITFVESTCQPGKVQAALTRQLCAHPWPGEVQGVQWQVLATGDLVAQQPGLFAEVSAGPVSLAAVVDKLTERYGPYLFCGQVHEPGHLVAERRSHFHRFTADMRR
jgi:protein ImuB